MLFPIKAKGKTFNKYKHYSPFENELWKYEKYRKCVFFIRDIKLTVPYSKYIPFVQWLRAKDQKTIK